MSNATAPPPRPAAPGQSIETLNLVKEIEIDAPQDVVFESILEEITTGSTGEKGLPMAMKLEAWPGGRWYRDLGDNTGHFWGHVQVIKPPKLLELCGPMFMSYPVASHVQYRLTPGNGRTLLKLTHRAVGLIDPEHARGVNEGWGHVIENIARIAKRRAAAK